MAEDFNDRLARHEKMIEELRGIARQQAQWNEQQMVFNRQIIAVHSDLVERLDRFDAHLERMEHILERMLPGSENGRRDG